MRIQHNIAAINAYRNYNMNQTALGKDLEKLSSGYRINRAGDDAAGLAISEKMRMQLSGMEVAQNNVKDGMSLIRTGEGALTEVHDMLNRLNKLSEQSANATYSDNDRAQLQMEFAQISDEIGRIASTTNFNGINLFQNKGLDYELGQDESDFDIDLDDLLGDFDWDLDWDKEGELENLIFDDVEFDESVLEFATTQSASGASTVTSKYKTLANKLQNQIVPQVVKAITNRYTAFSYLNGSSIGIGLRLYNNSSSGVVASVTSGLGKSGSKYYQTYQLSINVAHVGNINKTADRSALERTISHEMIHAFMDETLTSGMFGRTSTMKSTTAFPSWFTEGMAQTASGPLGYVTDKKNGLGLSKNSSLTQIRTALSKSAAKLTSGKNVSLYGTGYLACMYLGYRAAGGNVNMNSATAAATGIAKGLSTVLKEIAKGSSLNTVVKKYTGYSTAAKFASSFANDSKVRTFVKKLLPYATSTTGGVISGSLSKSDPVSNNTISNLKLFKLNSTKQKVKNVYPSSVTVVSGGSLSTKGKSAVKNMLVSLGLAADPESGNTGGIRLQVGVEKGNTVSIRQYFLSKESLGLDQLNISTRDGAITALDSIDDMIDRVSTIRGQYGAIQNALEHTLNNLGVMRENLQEAESVIRDTDMAEQMMKYTKNNILLQSAQAMLAQANQVPQGVLQMLQ